MEQIALKAQKRETGKQVSKRYRREGLITGVHYSKGEDNINILVHPLSMRSIVYTALTRVVKLEVEGEEKTYECVLKEVKFDPVTDKIVHFDLLGIKPGQTLSVEVPIKLIGQSEGVRAGGILNQALYKMRVKCLPADLPEAIEVDITNLKAGSFIYVGDLTLENIELVLPPNTVIATVAKSRASASRSATDKK